MTLEQVGSRLTRWWNRSNTTIKNTYTEDARRSDDYAADMFSPLGKSEAAFPS